MYLRKSRDNKNDKTLYCQTLDKNSRYKSLYIHAGMESRKLEHSLTRFSKEQH